MELQGNTENIVLAEDTNYDKPKISIKSIPSEIVTYLREQWELNGILHNDIFKDALTKLQKISGKYSYK